MQKKKKRLGKFRKKKERTNNTVNKVEKKERNPSLQLDTDIDSEKN